MSRVRLSLDQRSMSNLKPRRSQKVSIGAKGQLIPLLVDTPYSHLLSISRPRAGRHSKSPVKQRLGPSSLGKCHSLAHLKFRRQPANTVSCSQLPLSSDSKLAEETTHTVSDRKALETRIQQKLSELPQDPTQRLSILSAGFDELIEIDETYAQSLKLLKRAYEDLLADIQHKTQSELQKVENTQKEVLERVKVDMGVMQRKIEKLAKENYEMSKTIDEKDNEYSELQSKVIEISKTNIDTLPQTLETWKYLVTENKSYQELCQQMREGLRAYQYKEKKLLELLTLLKAKGYPVEAIYNAEILHQPESNRDESDSELLVSGSARTFKRPDNVPQLPISGIPPDSDDSSSSIHSATHGEVQKTLVKELTEAIISK